MLHKRVDKCTKADITEKDDHDDHEGPLFTSETTAAPVEVRGDVEISDEDSICERGRNGRADCHPKRLAVCETIVETMFNTENGDCRYVNYI